jgi:hypothetical protein
MLRTERQASFIATSAPDVGPLGQDAADPRPRTTVLFFASLLVALGVAVAACSSNSTSATTADSVVQQSGTGNKTIGSVALPKKWTVTWKFTCTNPVTARQFVLTATNANGAIDITDQTGLGGGGTKDYTQTGTFDFAITTSCGWHLSTGPFSPGSTTTTTAP